MDIGNYFSCLFVKFVLYTAGFLGEGTLLFFFNSPPSDGKYVKFRRIPPKMPPNSLRNEKKVVY